MSQIQIKNLTFYYDGSYEEIFHQVSLTLDTDWKLGLVGRNGRGKTTLFRILRGELEYNGSITSSVKFDYFPYQVQKMERNTIEIVEEIYPQYELWELCRELQYLDVKADIFYRPFQTLSHGEQTKVLLAILFLKEGNFLLIDEPTNHLDLEGRQLVAAYLKRKKGFILVSHDRNFLDYCVDHILSMNKQNLELVQGNFSSWWENKQKQDAYEQQEKERLKKDINRLQDAARRMNQWLEEVEKTKLGQRVAGLRPDRGHIGHQAAKMMKRSKVTEIRIEKQIEKKKSLLKNVEQADQLKIFPLKHHKKELFLLEEVNLFYGDCLICKDISFQVKQGEIVALQGKNGCGKSSLLKAMIQLSKDEQKEEVQKKTMVLDGLETMKIGGQRMEIASGLKISYVPQDTSHLKGNLDQYAEQYQFDQTVFKTLLRKLDFSREQFEKKMESYSAGQKKKVLLARSLCEQAHLYLWDEPLNYIDIFSRMQIEELIREYHLTMVFVEHDQIFTEHLATKIIEL